MEISQNGIEFIKKVEGCELVAYKCSSGVWTIGYGHTGTDIKQGKEISLEKAERYLKNDLVRFCKAVNDLVNVELTQNQFDALVSFVFNIGIGAFASSTLLRLLNQKKYVDAANQFDRWVYSGGKVSDGLVVRRKKEKEMFKT